MRTSTRHKSRLFTVLLSWLFTVIWLWPTLTLRQTNHHLNAEEAGACTNQCLWKAGSSGTWIQDWGYAKTHGQYSMPYVYPNGPYLAGRDRAFKASPDAPFPWRTSWRWHDYDVDRCQVEIMTHEKFCSVMAPKKLNVHRILFHGDSLSGEMYSALVSLLVPSSHSCSGFAVFLVLLLIFFTVQ